MQKATYTTLALSVIAATVLTVVAAPVLIQSAAADPAPKTVEEAFCDDPKFADRESCPGKSEDAQGGDRDDVETCVARNPGQAKQNDCEETDIVNP